MQAPDITQPVVGTVVCGIEWGGPARSGFGGPQGAALGRGESQIPAVLCFVFVKDEIQYSFFMTPSESSIL